MSGEINRPSVVKYWVAWGPSVTHYGITDTQHVTTTGQPNFKYFDDEQGQLDALVGLSFIPTLPTAGEEVTVDERYTHGGSVVQVRQTHVRTIDAPSTVPALFLTVRAPGTNTSWISNEQVHRGDRRDHLGVSYECVQTHVTQVDWEPQNTPALWMVQTPVVPGEWAPRLVVAVDDELDYLGDTYKVIQAHTTQTGWEPTNTLGVLWSVVAGGVDWVAGEAVVIGDERIYQGITYRCRQSHTTQVGWEPPNVLALWLPI